MERISRHLYKRGALFYGVFTDWKKRRRTFPLGFELKAAKRELAVLEERNLRKEDFDVDKIKGYTFSKWVERYLSLVKNKRSLERDVRSCKRMMRSFGGMAMSEITRARVMEYKNERLAEGLKVSSVNRELACLKYMMRLAADENIIEGVPPIKLDSEKHLARERIISETEFAKLLAAAPRYLQRVLIGLSETGMRRDELLTLKWSQIDIRNGVIRLSYLDTKEGATRIIPISTLMYDILTELRVEQERVANLERRVFTREGKPIKSVKTIFEKVRADVDLRGVVLHDLRHTAITRWIASGMPPPGGRNDGLGAQEPLDALPLREPQRGPFQVGFQCVDGE